MKHSILAIFAFLVLSTSVFAQTVVSMNYIDKYDTTLVTHSPIIFSGNSTTWGGALTIKAPSAGTLGQLFVSGGASADPGYLSGQGAAGDFLISAGGGANPTFSTIKQLSILGQDSVTTSTTPVPSGLSFVAAANSTYVVDGYLRDSASTIAGIRFEIYAPSAITAINGSIMGSKKSDTCGFDIITADSSLSAAFTTYVPTTNYGVQNLHFVFVNGANAQTVSLYWERAAAGTAVLKKYSYLEAWKQ